MFGVERHSMISLASGHGITPHDFICRGINYRKNVLVLQVYVYFACEWIVLRHSGFTVEAQRADDFVLLHVDDGLSFSSFVRNIQFVKGRGIRASVRLRLRL